jgi:hypothetical protein
MELYYYIASLLHPTLDFFTPGLLHFYTSSSHPGVLHSYTSTSHAGPPHFYFPKKGRQTARQEEPDRRRQAGIARRQTDRQTERQTERQAGRQMPGRQAGRQTGRTDRTDNRTDSAGQDRTDRQVGKSNRQTADDTHDASGGFLVVLPRT